MTVSMGVGDASLNMKIVYTQQIVLYKLVRKELRLPQESEEFGLPPRSEASPAKGELDRRDRAQERPDEEHRGHRDRR